MQLIPVVPSMDRVASRRETRHFFFFFFFNPRLSRFSISLCWHTRTRLSFSKSSLAYVIFDDRCVISYDVACLTLLYFIFSRWKNWEDFPCVNLHEVHNRILHREDAR